MKSLNAAVCVAMLACFVGCHLEGAPDPKAGLGPRTQVVAPVIEDQLGMLFVDDDGTWVFRTDDPARVESYERGQVVAFGDIDTADRHLFGVIAKHNWGLRLQRLDSERVDDRGSGSLIPLNGFDHETGRRWGFCAGSGSPAEADCLRESPPGTRWRLYPLEEARLVVDEVPMASRKRAPVLPVELIGLVAVGTLDTDVLGDVRGDWFAVPTAPLPRPTHPRIAVDPACGESLIGGPSLDATWVVAEINDPEHPIETSSEAYRLGADTLVDCDAKNVRISVPGLYRRRLPVPGQDHAVGPLLAAGHIELRRGSVDTARLVARLGGAIATGDWASADFWNERLARHASTRTIDTVLVDSMASVAQGGRPEAAAYTGRYAIRLDWNPETSPAWQFGMAAVEEALGNKKNAIVRATKIPDAIDRSGDDVLHGWFAYFWALGELTNRDTVGETLEALKDHPEFRMIATATLARRTGGERSLDQTRQDFVDAGAGALHDALAGRDVAMSCDRKCAPDVYGRIWAAGSVEPQALSRVPRIDLRPGYRLGERPEGEAPMKTAARLLAVYPLLDEADQRETLQQMVDATLAWTDATCSPTLETPSEQPADDLTTLRRLGVDAALRMTDWKSHPIDATMAWLAIRGVPAACSSTAELVARSRELADNIGSASVPARFLELHLKKTPDERLPNVLAGAASFATDFERGQRCVDWNLALAAGLAEARRFEDARPWLEATARCDVIQRETIDLVAAYLNFERTAAISSDFGRKVRARLARVVHASVADDRCVATQSLKYRLTPELPETIRGLVARLDFEPRPTEGELQVVTATDQVATALENLQDTSKRLDAREWVDAAKSLGWARDRFETVEHEVGLARVRWLDEYLFGGEQERVASGAVKPEERLPGVLLEKKAKFSEVAAAANAPAALRLAHALISSDADAIAKLASKDIVHREELCAAPSPRPEGSIVLDRREGVLRAPDEGGPSSPGQPPKEEVKPDAERD